MHVILMGAQGAGKGTQASLLAPRLELIHVSTGDLFRGAIAAKTTFGQHVQRIIDRGELVPDDVTVGLVEEKLDDISSQQSDGGGPSGALFDGFPRNRAQADGLDAALAARGDSISSVVVVDVPYDILVRRLAGRRVCQNCGAVYHIEFQPPNRPGVCDRCGGEVVQRDDDRPEPIKRRLDLYFQETEPLIEFYRERGILATVNGDQPIEQVSEDILDAIGHAVTTRRPVR